VHEIRAEGSDIFGAADEDEESYNEQVNSLIRQKCSLSEKLAILRQRDTKPEEFQTYFTCAEEYKSKAKKLDK